MSQLQSGIQSPISGQGLEILQDPFLQQLIMQAMQRRQILRGQQGLFPQGPGPPQRPQGLPQAPQQSPQGPQNLLGPQVPIY